MRAPLLEEIAAELERFYAAAPIVDGTELTGAGDVEPVLCPHDRQHRVGTVRTADSAAIETALASAHAPRRTWDRLGGDARARILDKAADLYERDRVRLMAVMVREAGKTLDNALGDVREAVDFLRYYAAEARRLFGGPVALPGPTGETNLLELRGRGPFACISPWNFPLAIFTGQVAAALAAGNPVLAKPAEQTPIAALLAVQLLHEAGVPPDVLHLLPGDGAVGAALVKDPRVAGVAFTGSNETGWAIQRALAERRGAIVPFIAETGGLNAMIADFERAARAGDPRRGALGLRLGGTALLGRAPVLRAGGRGRADDRHADRRGRGARHRRSHRLRHRHRPRHRRGRQEKLEAHKQRMRREASELVDLALPEHAAPAPT